MPAASSCAGESRGNITVEKSTSGFTAFGSCVLAASAAGSGSALGRRTLRYSAAASAASVTAGASLLSSGLAKRTLLGSAAGVMLANGTRGALALNPDGESARPDASTKGDAGLVAGAGDGDAKAKALGDANGEVGSGAATSALIEGTGGGAGVSTGGADSSALNSASSCAAWSSLSGACGSAEFSRTVWNARAHALHKLATLATLATPVASDGAPQLSQRFTAAGRRARGHRRRLVERQRRLRARIDGPLIVVGLARLYLVFPGVLQNSLQRWSHDHGCLGGKPPAMPDLLFC